jgi:hypothetical protein
MVHKNPDWSAFGLCGKYRMLAIPTVPPEGQTEKWKALKPRVKAENVPIWAQRSQESIWEFGGKVGDGAGKRVTNVRCAQKTTRRGVSGKGSRKKGCRGAEHGQTCTKDYTCAVALRSALESAVQLGRGDEVNRQA